MNSSFDSDLSHLPAALRDLNEEQQQRLTKLLDDYLCSLEQGAPQDVDRLAADHPDLADALRNYLTHLDALHDVAAGFYGGKELSDDAEGLVDKPNDWRTDERRLGDFQLLREIGRGGMGIVYEARQISLDRRVAIKVLPFAAVLDSKQISRFKNEAQAAAQVQHPHIVPVFAIGVDRGVHFYAMQFIDGQPLDRVVRQLQRHGQAGQQFPGASGVSGSSVANATELIDANRVPDAVANADSASVKACDVETRIEYRVPTSSSLVSERSRSKAGYGRAVAQLGADVARALDAAHEYGVVHRDVKPSNLLVDHQGKVWVTDFGLARCQTDRSITKSGDLVGTLRYMSPEQALGRSAFVDHRTDVYSLGATLYELLTLCPAFPGENNAELLRRIEMQEPISLRRIDAKIPVDLENIVLKAMAKEREDRYATAADFAADLERFLSGHATVARPPSWSDRATKWARRHQQWVWVGIAIAVLLVIGLSISTLLVSRANLVAKRHRAAAERNLEKAQQVIDHFGVQLSEELAGIPGAEAIHQQFLLDALEYYREFSQREAQLPKLREGVALAHSKAGTLQERIGLLTTALDDHRRAKELLKELHELNPSDHSHQRNLGICQNNLGRVLAGLGRLDEAQKAFREALDWQLRLVELTDETKDVANLARTHNNLGLVLTRLGRDQAAMVSLQQAIHGSERVADDPAFRAEGLQLLAASYHNLSALQLADDPAAALESSKIARDTYRELVAYKPTPFAFRSALAIALNHLGAIQLQQNALAAALETHLEAQQLLETLHQQAPLDRGVHSDLAITWNNLGRIQTARQEFRAATDSFRAALKLQADLVQQDDADVGAVSTLGGIFNNLGSMFESADRLPEAAKAFEHAIATQRKAWEAAPEVDQFRVFLSKHLYNHGQVLLRLGRTQEAADVALQRKSLWKHDPERLRSIAEELAALANAELLRLAAEANVAEKGGSAELPDGSPAARSPEDVAGEYQELAVATLLEAVDAGLVLTGPDDLVGPLASIADDPRIQRRYRQK